MTPHDLIAAFDVIADAPDGVKRLRELVIATSMAGAGNTSSIDTWRTVALSSLIEEFQNGTASRGGEGGPPVTVLRLADIKQGQISASNTRNIDLSPESARKYEVRAGDVLAIRVNGSADLVGRFVVVAEDAGWCYCDHLIRLRVRKELVLPEFLKLVGETPAARGHLASVTVSTAGQKTVNQKGLGALLVLLPPLPEQHRIVAKVDELMAFLDKLEAAKNARDATRTALRDAALAALRDADGPDDVEAAWGRIAGQMDDLFVEPGDVGPVRQAVLQLAVRGRLVRQDAGDEPASKLLERIPQKLSTKRGAGNSNNTRRPDADDFPFPLADGWAWSQLGNLLEECRNGASLSPNDAGHGFRLLRISAATGKTNGLVDLNDFKFVEAPVEAIESFFVKEGDLLSCRFNGNLHYVGSVAVVPKVGDVPVAYPDKLIRLRAPEVDHMYLRYAMNSQVVRKQVEAGAATTAGNIGINGAQVRSWLVPVPPVAEQHRIVAKVDELMALLDKLESRLREAKTLQAAFAAAAVHHFELEGAA